MDEYGDKIIFDLRNRSFIKSLVQTVRTLPAGVTSVACMGNSHVPGVLEGLKKEKDVTDVKNGMF